MSVQRRRRAKPMQEGRKAPYVMVGHWIAFHPDLAAQAKAVYLVMLAYANGEELSDTGSSEVWPAREAIAEACGWSRPQSCDQWIDQLVAASAVDVLAPEPGDPDRNNHYIVHSAPPDGYAGVQSQADFSAARRARRGPRKGDAVERTSLADKANVQLTGHDAVERTTRSDDDAVERTKGDAVERTTPMRSTAHEQEPVTRTNEQGGLRAGANGQQEASTPDANAPLPDPQLDWRPEEMAVCPEHRPLRIRDPRAEIPSCPKCGRWRKWRETQKAAAAAPVEADEQTGKACRMCVADGPARGGGTRWLRALPGTQVVVTPYAACDHVTPHAEFMAGLAAADTDRGGPPVEASVPVSSAEARARAREIAGCKSSNAAASRVRDRRAEVAS